MERNIRFPYNFFVFNDIFQASVPLLVGQMEQHAAEGLGHRVESNLGAGTTNPSTKPPGAP